MQRGTATLTLEFTVEFDGQGEPYPAAIAVDQGGLNGHELGTLEARLLWAALPLDVQRVILDDGVEDMVESEDSTGRG